VLATAQTCAVIGLDGLIVQVEVDISPGLPAFKIAATQYCLLSIVFSSVGYGALPLGV
jgi:hypothetical protein